MWATSKAAKSTGSSARRWPSSSWAPKPFLLCRAMAVGLSNARVITQRCLSRMKHLSWRDDSLFGVPTTEYDACSFWMADLDLGVCCGVLRDEALTRAID